jgi:hypothetical protein
VHPLERCHIAIDVARERSLSRSHSTSTSPPKRALLWVLTASFLVAAQPEPPGLWRCKHRDGRGADMEDEATATARQT